MDSEELRQRIIERLGTFPVILTPALPTPEVLEELWNDLRFSYLDSLLPRRLKEKVALRISLYGSVPFAIFWHCCELKECGVSNAEILAILESPADIAGALGILRRYPKETTQFSSTLENAIAIATEGVLLRFPEIDQLQGEIRRVLGNKQYNRWVVLLSYMELIQRWVETHPENGLEVDTVILNRCLETFKDEPRLIDFLSRWRVERARNLYLEERLTRAGEIAPEEKALRRRFRAFSQIIAISAAIAALTLVIERFIDTGAIFQTLIFDLKASIGMATLIASVSILTWNFRPLTRMARVAARTMAVLVCIISIFIFLPGLASFLTAFVFFLLGLALLILERAFYGKSRWSEWLTYGTGVLGYVSLLANAFGLNGPLPGSDRLLLMSLAAASLSIMLTIATLAAHPSGRLLAMIGGTSHSGHLIRRAILLVILFPVVFGWIGAVGEWAGWYHPDIPLMIIGNLLLLGGIAWAMGRSALRSEHQQEKVETLLLHRDQDFRGTFDQAAVGMAHLGLDGRYIRVNDRLCEILNCSREDLLGNPIQEMIHPDDRAELLECTRRLMTGEITEFSVEKRYLLHNQNVIWVSISAAILLGSKGERRYAVIIIEEITERKMAEEEAARQKANAEAASQAKDNLLSVISHELRTPLTPVLATLSGITAQTEEERKLLTMIRRNVEHEICLIDDLLDLTRLTHAKIRLSIKPLDLHPLINEVATSLRPSFKEKDLGLHLRLEAERSIVNGDSSRLRQVLINLLDNARKFTPAGGDVTVKTGLLDDRIMVRVTDTGPGISPENLTRIFEAFEQVDQSIQRSHGGLGLGLTITKGLVEAHAGTIGAESEGVGHGATIFFTLPISDAALPAPSPSEHPPLLKNRRILLVEDHDDTRMTLEHLLERRGHEVCAVSQIGDALNAVKQTRFDVVISDLRLPDGNGLDLPSNIAAATGYALPCLALSGLGSEEDEQRSLEAGFARHLTKPIDFHDLESAILQAGDAKSKEAGK